MAPTRSKANSQKGKLKKRALNSKMKPPVPTRSRGPPTTAPAVRREINSAAKTPTKKRRIYSEKELSLPRLNMITPAGVQKPKGVKKGKVFIDDQESMMTILAMVNADKAGEIESKIVKARQMEEIRQARQAEMQAKQEKKKSKLEGIKDEIRRSRLKKTIQPLEIGNSDIKDDAKKGRATVRRRVSFK